MSQPFRDEYSAAVDRAELLARENEELRAELARVQPSVAIAPAEAPSPPPDSLKRRTLEQLERLSEEIDAHADATTGELRVRVEPLRDERGAPQAVAGSATDPHVVLAHTSTELEAQIARLVLDKKRLELALANAQRPLPSPELRIVMLYVAVGAVVGYVLSLLR